MSSLKATADEVHNRRTDDLKSPLKPTAHLPFQKAHCVTGQDGLTSTSLNLLFNPKQPNMPSLWPGIKTRFLGS